ncbi:MAG: UPF0182 family protein [Gemmatimonadales bacterium]
MSVGLGRRAVYIGGAILLVVLLVGGRWLAIETAERTWARSFTGGGALVEARTLGLLLRALVLACAVAWATGNLLIVYRAIGSVQMPRRLGNLEIVEAVSPRILFRFTIALGVIAGVLLALGTRDWWRLAVLAAAPPTFGVSDETLGHDVGYYLAVLPWRSVLHTRALLLTISAVVGVGALYAAIGSLRIRRARIVASDRARGHCGVLMAALALVIAWGGALDPAQVVGGFHGPVDAAALAARVPGARFVAAVAVVTALVSLVWAWRDWPNLIISGWAALLLALAAGYLVIPGIVRAGQDGDDPLLQSRRATLERVAFGLGGEGGALPPAFASAEAAASRIPLWDAERVAAMADVPAASVALRPASAAAPPEGAAAPTWLIAPPPLAPVAITRIAVETDSGLALSRLPTRDSIQWFAPGLRDIAVVAPDTWPALRQAGIELRGSWRRWALAWTLQQARLARDETDGQILLWRRDIVERLEALAPFARFGAPTPAVADSALWWLSWGYVTGDYFPLVRPQTWRDGTVRYLRAGLLGAVRVATGETHIWLAPGYDSLTAAWAHHFHPLIEPADRVPQRLLVQVPYPEDAFRLGIAQVVRAERDSTLTLRPHTPFHLPGPDGRLWTAIGLQSGIPPLFEGLYVATMDAAPGPRVALWRPVRPTRLPGELVGSSALRAGTPRIWRAGRAVFTLQAQFVHPMGADPPARPEVAQVYVSLDERTGHGPTALAALRGGAPADTSLAARWERARRLAVQADSALNSGDLELFARLFRQLVRQLAPPLPPR